MTGECTWDWDKEKKFRKTLYLYCNSCFFAYTYFGGILRKFGLTVQFLKKYVDHTENIAFLAVLVKDLSLYQLAIYSTYIIRFDLLYDYI